MSVEKLLEEYGTLCYEEGLTGSENAKDAASDAKAALLSHVEGLRVERDAAQSAFETMRTSSIESAEANKELRAENERLKAEKEQDAALIADGFELVKHVQQLEQRNAELRALAADIVRAVEILEPIEIADSAALQRLKDFLNVQG